MPDLKRPYIQQTTGQSENQYDVRKGCSTIDAIIRVMDSIRRY